MNTTCMLSFGNASVGDLYVGVSGICFFLRKSGDPGKLGFYT